MHPPLPRLQDLPPRWARFCLGIGAFAEHELGCDFTRASCVVACSGGSDSTALLLIAVLLCRRNGGNGGRVLAAHLDHGLRAQASADARFVEHLCERLHLDLVCEAQNIQAQAESAGTGVEEAGRHARYALLEQVRRKAGAEVILLGHQLNDLAEDQLLRLMRGTGWPGLGGMAGFDPSRSLLRPLLLTPRSILEDFLRISGQTWQVDQSNFERTSTRNRVRQDLLPGFERENPAYLESVARLWRQARLDEEHWDEALSRLLSLLPVTAPGAPVLLPAQVLAQAPPALRLRLYKAALEDMGPGQPLCDGLFRLDALWRQKATGKRLRFPGDKEARIAKSGVCLQVIDRKKECG
jgi:tRNA(Ile)-lysidine synthase